MNETRTYGPNTLGELRGIDRKDAFCYVCFGRHGKGSLIRTYPTNRQNRCGQQLSRIRLGTRWKGFARRTCDVRRISAARKFSGRV